MPLHMLTGRKAATRRATRVPAGFSTSNSLSSRATNGTTTQGSAKTQPKKKKVQWTSTTTTIKGLIEGAASACFPYYHLHPTRITSSSTLQTNKWFLLEKTAQLTMSQAVLPLVEYQIRKEQSLRSTSNSIATYLPPIEPKGILSSRLAMRSP